jgi:hypothetical protein
MVFELVNCPGCGRGVVSTVGPGGRRHVIDVDPIEEGTLIRVGPSGATRESIPGGQGEPPPLHVCGGGQPAA